VGSRSLWEAERILLRLNSVVGAKGFALSRLKSRREAGSNSLWEAGRIPWLGKSFQLGKRSAECWKFSISGELTCAWMGKYLFFCIVLPIEGCLVILRLRAKLDTHRVKKKKQNA